MRPEISCRKSFSGVPRCDKELVPYVQRMRAILVRAISFPSGASKIYDHLYLSGVGEARDLRVVRDLKLTHVINCASSEIDTSLAYYAGTGVHRFVAFPADDAEEYPILQHFEEAFAAIEEARETKGRALIHCQMGVNRSGALAVAYVMAHEKCGPVAATQRVMNARRYLLSNEGFQVQLVEFAKKRDLLLHDTI